LGGLTLATQSIHPVAGQAGLYALEVKVPAGITVGDEVTLKLQIPQPDGHMIESNTVTVAIDGTGR
jgi:hypothetical protein